MAVPTPMNAVPASSSPPTARLEIGSLIAYTWGAVIVGLFVAALLAVIAAVVSAFIAMAVLPESDGGATWLTVVMIVALAAFGSGTYLLVSWKMVNRWVPADQRTLPHAATVLVFVGLVLGPFLQLLT